MIHLFKVKTIFPAYILMKSIFRNKMIVIILNRNNATTVIYKILRYVIRNKMMFIILTNMTLAKTMIDLSDYFIQN